MHWADIRKIKKIDLKSSQKYETILNIIENADLDISLAKNSHLKLFVRQVNKAILNIRFNLAENSRVDLSCLSREQRKGKVTISLNGANSIFNAKEFSFSDCGGEYEVIHNAKHTVSNIDIRGVVQDAKVNTGGKVYISREASGSEAFISGKFISIKGAEAIFYPNMEILNKDVKASHSASIVHLDEDELFYMESRGINKQKAEKMLIRAFMNIPENLR